MTSTPSQVVELFEILAEIDRSNDEEWLRQLDDRKVAESAFHDEKVDRHGLARDSEDRPELQRGNSKYYSTVGKSKQYLHEWICRHAPGKVVLDYACGQGGLTRQAAHVGAALAIGMDISRVSISNARSDAADDGLSNTCFIQGDCEDTRLPDGCIDVLLCSGMLHHLDVHRAFPEMHRILRPGGVCLAVEALDYSPVVKLYRLLTPQLRTEWEKHHILSHRDLRVANNYFSVQDVRYWHLLSIMTTPLRRTRFFNTALNVANAVDSVVLKYPPVSYMAWQFSFELHKNAQSSSKTAKSAVLPARGSSDKNLIAA